MSALTLASTFTLSSGHKMPILGLGVYQTGRNECVKVCKAALEAGYRHIDSAIMYRNEGEVGTAVQESGLKREDVFVTSKVSSSYHGYSNALKAVDQSLERFDIDYLDLFLIHDPFSGKAKRLETWKALIKKRDDGQLRSIGVSNYGVHHLQEIKDAGLEAPSVNQLELHPWCQHRKIVEYCRKNSITIQAYSPLTKGYNLDDPDLVAIAKKYKKDVAQVLIRWSLQMGFSPLPKSSQASRILSNSQVYDFELAEEDMQKLTAKDRGDAGSISWNPVNAP